MSFFQVDAFASEAFKGNPAAVVFVHGRQLTSLQMQAIAAENNLSETAFLEHSSPGELAEAAYFATSSEFNLRWFTPAAEVQLCGHATLAAAAAIFKGTRNPYAELRFRTLSGVLSVCRLSQSMAGPLQMDLPCYPSQGQTVPADWQSPSSELMQALFSSSGVKVKAVEAELSQAASSHGLVGIIVTTCTDDGRILCRFFAPFVGINEDPVFRPMKDLGGYCDGFLEKSGQTLGQRTANGNGLTSQGSKKLLSFAPLCRAIKRAHLAKTDFETPHIKGIEQCTVPSLFHKPLFEQTASHPDNPSCFAAVTLTSKLPEDGKAAHTSSSAVRKPSNTPFFTEQSHRDLLGRHYDRGCTLRHTEHQLSQARGSIWDLRREIDQLNRQLTDSQLAEARAQALEASRSELHKLARDAADTFLQAEQQPAETDWGRQLVQAEHNSLLLQQQLCGSHTWTYLSEHLQLDLAEAIEIALVPATMPEECEAQGTVLAQRIKTAIRRKLRTTHDDKAVLLRRNGCLPSVLIENKALTLILGTYSEGFIPLL
ncbi:hypothetical protein WJX84_008452 [Apatococcus fuscideae]|uniref:Uncharacterized protein n=1 Tax=Apatococcus fuscideae TaxID=2026836 RepID=A0AAW1TI49_9CHLO